MLGQSEANKLKTKRSYDKLRETFLTFIWTSLGLKKWPQGNSKESFFNPYSKGDQIRYTRLRYEFISFQVNLHTNITVILKLLERLTVSWV